MNTELTDSLPSLIAIVAVLFINALLVACEMSLIKLRFSHFNPDLRDRLNSIKSISKLMESGDRTVRVIRLGLSACLIAYSLLLFPLVYAWISSVGELLGHTLAPLSLVFTFLIVLSFHHLVGELIPRAFGLAYPLQTLRLGALFIRVWGWFSRPIRIVMIKIARFGWKFWQGEDIPDLDSLDLEAQIELMSKDSPALTTVSQLILKNTLGLRNLVVADVLLPRNQVRYFDLNLSLEENLNMAKKSGHTRFPLCFGDLDRCLGLIHIKDIFRFPGDFKRIDLKKIKRNILRIDSEEPLENALSKLLSHKVHMALVIDEFRGTEGVLTLEKILEELVGDIRDEFDADEEELIKSSDMENEEIVVSGLTPLHELEALFDVDFDNEEVSTVGGMITSELGRIPEKGENLSVMNLSFEVTEVEETRVVEVKVAESNPDSMLDTNRDAESRSN